MKITSVINNIYVQILNGTFFLNNNKKLYLYYYLSINLSCIYFSNTITFNIRKKKLVVLMVLPSLILFTEYVLRDSKYKVFFTPFIVTNLNSQVSPNRFCY